MQLPADPGVVLGTEADLPRAAELGCDAVVSLSRLGSEDRRPAGVTKHLEQWLVDREDPADNGSLAWALHDSADAVRDMRDSAEQRVLLHWPDDTAGQLS